MCIYSSEKRPKARVSKDILKRTQKEDGRKGGSTMEFNHQNSSTNTDEPVRDQKNFYTPRVNYT